MPCNSDHMEPRADEVLSKHTAGLIVFVSAKLGITSHAWIGKAAEEYYGAPGRVDELSAELCRLTKMMSEDEKASIIFNGRDAQSRKLAEWYERHLLVDAQREQQETLEAARRAFVPAEITYTYSVGMDAILAMQVYEGPDGPADVVTLESKLTAMLGVNRAQYPGVTDQIVFAVNHTFNDLPLRARVKQTIDTHVAEAVAWAKSALAA